MIRTVLLLIPLLATGCEAFREAFSLPRSGYDVPIEELEPWAPAGAGAEATVLVDAYAPIPMRVRFHGDSAAAWALAWRGAGFDEDLLDVEAVGLTLHESDLDGEVRERPAPDLLIEGEDDALDRLDFPASTVPGRLAFTVDGTLWTLDPGADAWATRPLPPEVDTLTEVGPTRGLLRVALDEVIVVDASVWVPPAPAEDPVLGEAFGPFDGETLTRAWWTGTRLCVDRFDLASRSLASTVCHDSDVILGSLHNGVIGGSVEAVQLFLEDGTAFRTRLWFVADEDGVERMGALDMNNTDGLVAYPDDPQLDDLRVSYWRPVQHDEYWSADGTWRWTGTPSRDELSPAQSCGCGGLQDPYVCRCIDRRFALRKRVTHGFGQVWMFGGGTIDTRTRAYVQPIDVVPDVGTTRDPVSLLDPDWTPDDLPGPDGTPLLAILPGNGGDEADIGVCTTVIDGAGNSPDRDDRGPIFEEDVTYTLTAEDCPTDDGGPSPLPVTVAYGPDVEGFLFTDVPFARGLRLDPADDLPALASQLDAVGLAVRETTGWTALSLDEGGAVVRQTVDTVDAEAPLHLREGGRLLLDGGDVFDVEAGEVVQSLDVRVPPEDLLHLAGGRLLVEDSESRLALWDLDADPIVPLVDEVGARTAALLDASDDGAVVLEEDDGRIVARDTVGGRRLDLGSVGLGLQGAWLSADGAWGLTAVQTEAAGLRRVTLTAWAFTGAGAGFRASSVAACAPCRGWLAHHRDTGSFVQYEDDASPRWVRLDPTGDPAASWSLDRTVIRTGTSSDLGEAARRTDRYGRAWWREGTSMVAYDVDDGSLVGPTPLLGTLEAAWHGPAWLVDSSGASRNEPSGFDVHHRRGSTAPVPLAEGRALTVGGSPFAVRSGDWTPGRPSLIGEGTELLISGARLERSPLQSSWPCYPVPLQPYPPQVRQAAPWVCLR